LVLNVKKATKQKVEDTQKTFCAKDSHLPPSCGVIKFSLSLKNNSPWEIFSLNKNNIWIIHLGYP